MGDKCMDGDVYERCMTDALSLYVLFPGDTIYIFTP